MQDCAVFWIENLLEGSWVRLVIVALGCGLDGQGTVVSFWESKKFF
jgi:hypothetical protein